jgi:hypothetical protein
VHFSALSDRSLSLSEPDTPGSGSDFAENGEWKFYLAHKSERVVISADRTSEEGTIFQDLPELLPSEEWGRIRHKKERERSILRYGINYLSPNKRSISLAAHDNDQIRKSSVKIW